MRASWRRLLFFFLCVAIGVGAIVALRSVIQSLRHGLTREARAMIAADVIVQTNRAVDAGVRAPDRRDARRRRRSSPRPNRSRRRRWCAARAREAVARMVELQRRRSRVSLLRHARARGRASRTRTPCSSDRGALVGPELLVAARDARRRTADDRRPAVHDSRRHRAGARAPHRRIQLGPRVIIDLRRSAADGPARLRQPRELSAAAQGARGRRRAA